VYLVGLTGGIGSGKSTVAARFAELGAELIDADAIAREVVAPDGPALEGLVSRFGEDILRADGSLDRAALASVAFADDDARADLDRLTHPYIAARIAAKIAEIGARDGARPDDLVVVDHPLLIETGQTGRFDAVVVVVADEEVRVARLVEERGMDPEDIRARMRIQVDDDRRREVADHLVVNDGGLDELREQVDAVHAHLTEAARSPS
jgi:dephospho-CoA kinase